MITVNSDVLNVHKTKEREMWRAAGQISPALQLHSFQNHGVFPYFIFHGPECYQHYFHEQSIPPSPSA